jgi:hypothetical protein
MPAEFPPFDVAAHIVKENPQVFFACRQEAIECVISRADTSESLQLFQNRIDAFRLSEATPMRSVNTLMEMLGGHLSTLAELVAHWESVLKMDWENTEVKAVMARFPAMFLDIEGVRKQILEATGNQL